MEAGLQVRLVLQNSKSRVSTGLELGDALIRGKIPEIFRR